MQNCHMTTHAKRIDFSRCSLMRLKKKVEHRTKKEQPSEAVKPRRRRFDMQENVCKKYDITRKELQEGVNRYSDGDITEGAHHD